MFIGSPPLNTRPIRARVFASAASTNYLYNLKKLSQPGYDVNVYAANTLSAEGVSHLIADTLNIFKDSNLGLNVNIVNDMNGRAVLTARGQMSLNDISLNLVGTEFLTDGKYKRLTNANGTNLGISGWNINGIESPRQLCWEGNDHYAGTIH